MTRSRALGAPLLGSGLLGWLWLANLLSRSLEGARNCSGDGDAACSAVSNYSIIGGNVAISCIIGWDTVSGASGGCCTTESGARVGQMT